MTENQKKHLDKIHNIRRASYGYWTCKICGQIFDTRHQLKNHGCYKLVIKDNNNNFICPYCGKILLTRQSLGGHMKNCLSNPNRAMILESLKRGGKTLSEKIKNGQILPSFKGKHQSVESKQKIRQKIIEYLQTVKDAKCRYNKKSILYFDQLSKKNNWKLQHAENGGEFYTGIGYFVDAYDKDLNIVVEYDEKYHYADVENNILREQDIIRQNEIIRHLNCVFYRYNEKTNTLWKVN